MTSGGLILMKNKVVFIPGSKSSVYIYHEQFHDAIICLVLLFSCSKKNNDHRNEKPKTQWKNLISLI